MGILTAELDKLKQIIKPQYTPVADLPYSLSGETPVATKQTPQIEPNILTNLKSLTDLGKRIIKPVIDIDENKRGMVAIGKALKNEDLNAEERLSAMNWLEGAAIGVGAPIKEVGGGIAKSALSKIAKSKSAQEISNVIKSEVKGIAEKEIPVLADKLKSIFNPREVESVLKTSIQKAAQIIKPRFTTTKGAVLQELKAKAEQNKFLSTLKSNIEKEISERYIPFERIEKMEAVEKPTKAFQKLQAKEIVKSQQEKGQFLEKLKSNIEKEIEKPRKILKQQIGFQRKTKELVGDTISNIKQRFGIAEWKNATEEQLTNAYNEIQKLKKGDRFPTPKMLRGLISIFPEEDFTGKTTREISEKFGIGDPIKREVYRAIDSALPILRVKEKDPLLKEVIGFVQRGEQESFIQKKAITKAFDKVSSEAYKSRGLFGFLGRNKVWQNVYNKLSGQDVKLTEGEQKLSNFVEGYFQEAKEYLIKNGDMARGRQFYVPQRAAKLGELIKKYGILDGINKWSTNRQFVKEGAGLPADIWVNLDEIMGTKKFFPFALPRKGVLTPTQNVDNLFKEYMSLFETKKYLDKALPSLHATINLLTPKSGQTARWLSTYGKQLKGREYNLVSRAADKVVSFNYFLGLWARIPSAVKNLIGGEVNNWAYNGGIKYMLGKGRLLTNPFRAQRMISNYAVLSGDYVDLARGLFKGTFKKVEKAGYLPQKLAEMEIRSSQFLGQLTRSEWKSGTLTPRRLEEILDNMDITQGVFTPARSPILAKTPYGRQALQFSRWMITDAAMIEKAIKGSFRGEEKAKNIARVLRIGIAFLIGGYLADEYSRAGYDKAKQYAKVLQEPINAFIRTIDGELLTQMVADNPSVRLIRELNYSQKWLTYRMGFGDMPQPIEIKKGIFEHKTAAERQMEEAGLLEADTAYGLHQQLKQMKPEEANKKMLEIKKTDKQTYSRIKKYMLWDKLKLSDKERNFAKFGIKNGERAKEIDAYVKKQKNPQEVFQRLKKAKIITDEIEKQLRKSK